ncbi:apolipoprotein N-acyltransferase [Candidatus Electronema sp. JM]|uniref:apolipoprotein N-acyltransferase n=1 Tax=Candidatus Electronema sp. JM TaxID=3401571 RepID=UPI003AA7D309
MTSSATQSQAAALAAPVFSALLLALAMPGLTGWWPLLFVALIPLLWAARTLPSAVQSGCMGMFFGLLYYFSLMYWIIIVLKRYGGLHTVVAAAALLLLALYLAAYTAFFCILLNRLTSRTGSFSASVLLAAPTIWVGLDVARGWLFTGLPWMDLGYGLYSQPLLVQAADLGGHHLITFFIIQINALLLWLLERLFSPYRTSKRQISLAVMSFLVIYCAGGYSMLRWQQIGSEAAMASQATAAAVQGNISQDEKWSPALKQETVARYLALSEEAARKGGLDLLVWPETALPFYPHREPLMNKVKTFAKEKQVYLLTGSPYFTVRPGRQPQEEPVSASQSNNLLKIVEDFKNLLSAESSNTLRPVEYFNSAILLDRSGTQTGRYNKQHLVPFGEYVPLRNFLWFIKPLVELIGDFTPGESSKPLEAGHIKAGVLICFESIFPNIARNTTAEGANLLVNLTNDAWYGRSSAPQQSWAMTVLRAVENRRSLVRAANTGISGFIAPTGEVIQQSSLFTEAYRRESVPLLTGQTFFVQGGYWFGPVCLLLTGYLLIHAVWMARKRRQKGGAEK